MALAAECDARLRDAKSRLWAESLPDRERRGPCDGGLPSRDIDRRRNVRLSIPPTV